LDDDPVIAGENASDLALVPFRQQFDAHSRIITRSGQEARSLHWNADSVFLASLASLREIYTGSQMTENELAKQIVDAAYRLHTTLGPGLLESVYELTLAWEREKRGLRVARQVEVPILYQDTRIEAGFRADRIVEDKVIVEIKSVEALAPVHK